MNLFSNKLSIFIVTLAVGANVKASLSPEAECTVSDYKNVENAIKTCNNLVLQDITVPAGEALELKLKPETNLTLKGVFRWKFKEWEGPLFVISGKKISVIGDGVILDGCGTLWWDGIGDKGKKKPKFIRIKTTDGSTFKNIKILNCPRQCVSINNANDTTIENFEIDVSAGGRNGGHNTDGFDVYGCNITIMNTLVHSQDDCIAVNRGYNMLFSNLTCIGGHGLSLSVGQSPLDGDFNTVNNITFMDSTVINSDNGIHIKTHSNAGTGAIKDVTYKNIKLSGIRKFGINIQQDYNKGRPTKKPKGNIPITNLILSSITGGMRIDINSTAIYILCGCNGCNNWNFSNVAISGGQEPNSCNYTPFGFKC